MSLTEIIHAFYCDNELRKVELYILLRLDRYSLRVAGIVYDVLLSRVLISLPAGHVTLKSRE